jgi:phosphatidylglycerophosphate synthase
MSRVKVAVTDELLDAYVNRPLAAWIVRAVLPTPVTPNQLTLVSALWGSLAGACFASTDPAAPIAGSIALFLSMVFDCSDGQLARARGGGSVVGRIFDGYADYWVALWLHVGILVHLGKTGVVLFGHPFGPFERFLFALLAGLSMGVNAGRFDYYKQRFLAHTGVTREPETPEMYRSEIPKAKLYVEKMGLELFAAYVELIQKGDGYRLGVAAAKHTASDPERVRRFIAENAALVRLWSLTGPTMHLAAMCATGLLVRFVPDAFTYYCVFALLAVNAYSAVLWILQRRVLRREQPIVVST